MKRLRNWLRKRWSGAAKRGRDACGAACRLCGAGRSGVVRANRWLEPLWPWLLFAFLAASVAATVFWWKPLSGFLRETGSDTQDAATTNMVIVRNLGLALAALVGLVFTWWRSHCLSKQTRVAEQGLITDRFIKATEQLGRKEMSVRIGAIYSLWRIAVDSESQSDKRAVLDMLCAFARAPYEPEGRIVEGEGENAKIINPGVVRDDIQIVLNLIGLKMKDLKFCEEYIINLVGALLPRLQMRKARLLSNVTVDFTEADLSEASFSEAILSNAVFTKTNLYKADFFEAHFFKVFFKKVRFEGARFIFARLEGAYLEGECLKGTDFQGAHLKGAHLSLANFEGVNLKDACLEGAHLKEANLYSVNLSKAHLNFANLSLANLSLANLSFAKLVSADLSFADLSLADLKEASLSLADIEGARLSCAILSRANLEGALLPGTDLSYADFSGANLTRANFTGAISNNKADLERAASLERTRLPGTEYLYADLSEADLSGANLSGVIISRKADLEKAASLEGANLDGIIYLDEQPSDA